MECTNYTVPLNWNNTQSSTIQNFIWKLKSPSSNPTAQLWMLNGGPGITDDLIYFYFIGGDGSGLIPLAQTIISVLSQGIDILLPDHRGTGYSSIVVISCF